MKTQKTVEKPEDIKQFEKLQEKANPFVGTLVLDYFEIVKLQGIDYDGFDFYWVYLLKDGSKTLMSCVGSFIPLKGIIDDRSYNHLVWVWNKNTPRGNRI